MKSKPKTMDIDDKRNALVEKLEGAVTAMREHAAEELAKAIVSLRGRSFSAAHANVKVAKACLRGADRLAYQADVIDEETD